MLQIDLPTALWHVLHVKTEKLVLSASAPSSANDTYTVQVRLALIFNYGHNLIQSNSSISSTI